MKLYTRIITATAAALLLMTSCYNDFSQPKDNYEFNDELVQILGGNLITIQQLKDMFGDIQGSGTTSSRLDTRYKRFVSSEDECTQFEKEKGWYVLDKNYWIKGKVISNDEQGNVYKSLYIFDGTGSIELKLTNGLYLDYPLDLKTKESCWVYVSLNGLYLGNYRLMLSLGDIPTEGVNAYGDMKYYANSNLVSVQKVREHVYRGEKTTLTEGTNFTDDILVIEQSTCKNLLASGGSKPEKYFGHLMRFKGVKVMYKGVKKDDGTTADPLKNGSFDQIYPSWICTSGLDIKGTMTQVVNQPWYKMAYSKSNTSLYGSFLAGYDLGQQYTSDAGLYVVRTSGYSRFANKFLPKDGTVGEVLGIYCVYTGSACKSSFTGGANDYATYQISVSRYEDMQFEMQPDENPAWSRCMLWADENYPKYPKNSWKLDQETQAVFYMQQSWTLWENSFKALRPQNASAEWNSYADDMIEYLKTGKGNEPKHPSQPDEAMIRAITWAVEHHPAATLYTTHEALETAWEQVARAIYPDSDAKWTAWMEHVLTCLKNTPEDSYALPLNINDDDTE